MSTDNEVPRSPSAPTNPENQQDFSFFDTFEMPTTEIVATSVEEALSTMSISDAMAEQNLMPVAPDSEEEPTVDSEVVPHSAAESAAESPAEMVPENRATVDDELAESDSADVISDVAQPAESEPSEAQPEVSEAEVAHKPDDGMETTDGSQSVETAEPVADAMETVISDAMETDISEAIVPETEVTVDNEIASEDEVAAASVQTKEHEPESAADEFVAVPSVEQPPSLEQPSEVVAVVEDTSEVTSSEIPTPEPEAVSEVSDSIQDEPAVTGEPAATVPVVEQTDSVVNHSEADIANDAAPEVAEPANGFRVLNLRDEIVEAVEARGYSEPTEIQAQIIPHIVAGRDVLAQSQTGTGKTAAFALPILSEVNTKASKPQALILAPTRELAGQVAESFEAYGEGLSKVRVAAIYGGAGYNQQLQELRRGVAVVVGTPGRVIDHIKRGTLDLSDLKCLVLDEADEMLNMGFLEDVQFVLQQTPPTRQVALFSATLPPAIRKIAEDYLNDPARVTVKRKTMTAEAIRQRAVVCQHRDKLDVLSRFLEVETTDGVIIFTRTREATVTVAEYLVREGFKAVALNGDMAQNVRERTIDQLKKERLDIVVATDVAARGLDVSRISHVFNFDPPQDTESYIHRIGRTGRAGRAGEAIIMVSNAQRYKLRHIERLTKQPIEVVAPPSADEINASRVNRFRQQIADTASGKDLSLYSQILSDFASESELPMETIAAALAHISHKGRTFFVEDRPKRDRRDRDDHRGQRDDRGPRSSDRDSRFGDRQNGGDRRPRENRRAGRVEAGMDRYRIEVGHDDGVRPGNIVGAIANEAGIEGRHIGPINIYEGHSTIDLPEGMPSDVFNTLQDVRVAGKQLKLRRATESDNHGQSSFRRGPKRGGKRFGGKGGQRHDRRKGGRKRR